VFRVRPARRGGLLRYQECRWRGEPVPLQDGTLVRRNDRIIRLHLDNPRLMRQPAGGRMAAIRSLATLAADLDALAEHVRRHRRPAPVALHAVTLHASLGRRFRFERRALARTPLTHYLRFVLILLMALFHPEGIARLRLLHEPPWPDEIWLSAPALLRRGEAAPSPTPRAAAASPKATLPPRGLEAACRAAPRPPKRRRADPAPASGRRPHSV